MHAFYDWFGLNRTILLAVNGMAGGPLDPLMRLGTWLGDFEHLPWLVLGLLILALFRRAPASVAADGRPAARSTRLATTMALVLGALLAGAMVEALKTLCAMPRPASVLPAGSVHLLMAPDSPYSFPSGHATFAMLLVTVCWPCCRPPWRLGLVGFAAWVGLSRLYVGAHFPADVLAGFLCGWLSGWLALRAQAAMVGRCPRLAEWR